ncbi:MAG: hypothetical protein V7632_260 [Bradyrhizobium sp.]
MGRGVLDIPLLRGMTGSSYCAASFLIAVLIDPTASS